MKKITTVLTVLFILFSLVSLVMLSGCSFVSSDQAENPMDPECQWFVGFSEAATIYARAAEIGEPLALEEAAVRFETNAAVSSGDTARDYKKIAFLLREQAERIRDGWDPSPY